MANINLLPDDFRQREQKEIKKASRHSREVGVELTSGQKTNIVGADQDKPSFWARLFGTSSPKQKQLGKRTTSLDKPENVSQGNIAKPSPAHHAEPKAVYQPRTTRWADILGTGVVKPDVHKVEHPIKGSHHTLEKIHQPIADSGSRSVEPSKAGHSHGAKSGAGRMGWWQIIRSIFVPAYKAEPTPVSAQSHHDQKKDYVAPVKERHQEVKVDKKDKSLHDAPKTSKLLVDVNLIPQELLLKKHWSPRTQVSFVLIAVIVPALLVVGVYVGIMQLQRSTDRDIAFERQRMEQITNAVASLHKRQATDRHLERKLVAINELMKQHIRWSSFFTQLEKYTLDGVYYTDIKADVSGELVLPAVAPNYEVAAQQLVALRGATDFVSDAQVNAMQVLTDSKKGVIGVSFNLKIVLQDNVLLAQ
jgi:Tfp pilus assembly protein PilN